MISGRSAQTEEIESVKTKHAKAGGWSQSRYQPHEENYPLHHAKEVVENLERVARDGYAPILPSNPVAGAFGDPGSDTPTDQDQSLGLDERKRQSQPADDHS
jgi:hypothetical protein